MINQLIWQHAYLTTLYLAAMITLALAIYAWFHRTHPGSTLFALLMLSTSAYILFMVLLISSTSPDDALSILNWVTFMLTIMIALFFCFVIKYIESDRWLNRYTIAIIVTMPILTQIIIMTNDKHHCFVKELELSQDGVLMGISAISYGNCYWAHTTYNYILLLIAIFLLVRFSIRSLWIYKIQSITLFIAVLIPILGGLHDAKIINSTFAFPIVPLCFSLMGALLSWNMFSNKMLDIIPIARETLIESMSDCLFVLDLENNVIDINTAAIKMFDLREEDIIWHSGEQIFCHWPKLLNQFRQNKETEEEICITRKEKQFYFDVKVSPVRNKLNILLGKMVVMRDVTQRVLAQNEVQESLQHVNKLTEELYKTSIRDPLTDLYNRRYLDEILPREISNANRSNSSMCFAMLDIDNFKLFNDTYGHKAGDQVLLFLANFFRENIRSGDLIFRYGGEEFMALFLHIDIPSARSIAERWQSELANQVIIIDGEEVNITISIGMAEYRKEGIPYQEIIHAADTALYQAKANGRNCISVFEANQ